MKKNYNFAPGNILQNMYLKNRIKKIIHNLSYKPRFIKIGSGNGNISNILLNLGISGIGCDLSKEACDINKITNSEYLENGQYKIENKNFFDLKDDKYEIIISSHVIEHFKDDEIFKYFEFCKKILDNDGFIITIVPSCNYYAESVKF